MSINHLQAVSLENSGLYQGLFTYRVHFLLVTDSESLLLIDTWLDDLVNDLESDRDLTFDHVSAFVPYNYETDVSYRRRIEVRVRITQYERSPFTCCHRYMATFMV